MLHTRIVLDPKEGMDAIYLPPLLEQPSEQVQHLPWGSGWLEESYDKVGHLINQLKKI